MYHFRVTAFVHLALKRFRPTAYVPQEEVEIIDRHTVMMITISRPPFAFFPFAFGGNVRQGCESNVAKFKMMYIQVENIWRKVEPYVQKELYIIGVYDNGWQIRLLN